MKHDETEIAERRSSQRSANRSEVHMTIEVEQLSGYADNISRTGVLFFSEQPLTVKVEMSEGGLITTRKGRLVRAQRMQGDSVGWAVEFDEA